MTIRGRSMNRFVCLLVGGLHLHWAFLAFAQVNTIELVHKGSWPVFVGGDAGSVQTTNGLAYVAIHFGGLAIFDVRDPDDPKPVGGLDTSGNSVRVKVVGTLAYMADGFAGLQIIDVADPAKPRKL